MALAYIGLGANLGDPAAAIEKALALIEQRGLGDIVRRSSLYRTEPVGIVDQPWFVNAAAVARTELALFEFHLGLQKIEAEMGRPAERIKNGPRPIDLDILLFDDLVTEDHGLIVPHPRMTERKFVMAPLAEIAGEIVHPILDRTVSELAASLADAREVEKL